MRAVIAVAVIALSLSTASPAAAAGVPGEITTYIATHLVDDLNEFYGPGQNGAGLLFTDDTTTGPAVRVLGLTSATVTDPGVRRLNRWVTVISIGEKVVGVATISIEPLTSTPQLDLYLDSPQFGIVITALPEGAQLVNDPDREAWFSLEGDTLTPLVAGSSGVTTPITLSTYRASLPTNAPDASVAPAAAPSALIIVGLVLVLIVLLLAVEAFFPFWRRTTAALAEAEPELEAEPEPEVEPEPEPAVETVATPAARKPRKKPAASA